MATRKMTVSIPAGAADSEKRLVRACDLANQDLDSVAIEDEWEQIQDRIEEPWDDARARVSTRTPFLRP